MIHYDLKTIFIHIPRTAGNSVSFLLREQGGNYENSGITKHKDLNFYKRLVKNLDKYFKFTIVRNPFEKIYSHYFFKRIRQDAECVNNDFNEWILKFHNKDKTGVIFKPQLDFITINKNIKVDYIISYERLEEDIKFIYNKLKIKGKISHLFASGKNYYADFYNEISIKIISNIFQKDLDYFKYGFGKK